MRLLTLFVVQIFLVTLILSLFFIGLKLGMTTYQYTNEVLLSTYIASMAIVLTTLFSCNGMQKFFAFYKPLYIVPNLLMWSMVVAIILELSSLAYSPLILGGVVLSFGIYYFLLGVWQLQKVSNYFALIPVGRAKELSDIIPDVQWLVLQEPKLKRSVRLITTDLHSHDLNDYWEQLIAEKTLQGVPVYHHRYVRESLTGRVKIEHMYENELGSLLPSKNYMLLKRILECALVLFTSPLTLPVMLITAVLIRLDTPGKILFSQRRVGQGGEEFLIYKFRSMRQDSEAQGAKMASANDMRVTRVGRFIRKVRIDELPQLWNVLKGDMSLIGPRPEQKYFVEQFEKTIPFYNYRHIVKPGITGWAQVTQGYAANEDETQIKVEHDFYYIKHFSFSLDLLIFFKTIHTMLTGFGAR